MGVLQRFERRVEALVNGVFARAFKAEVQPVEVASALQRECDDRAAIVARGRTVVPNSFLVELGPSDHERLNVYAEPLGAELADMVGEHAQEQGYSFLGPVSVAFELVEELDTGVFRVRSSAIAHSAAHPPATPPLSVPPGATATTQPTPRQAFLDINGTRVPLSASRTVIGRAADADLRVDDPGISRTHAEVRLGGDGAATMVDLGSTNGLVVDGERRDTVRLVDGARVLLGSTPIVFRVDRRGES